MNSTGNSRRSRWAASRLAWMIYFCEAYGNGRFCMAGVLGDDLTDGLAALLCDFGRQGGGATISTLTDLRLHGIRVKATAARRARSMHQYESHSPRRAVGSQPCRVSTRWPTSDRELDTQLKRTSTGKAPVPVFSQQRLLLPSSSLLAIRSTEIRHVYGRQQRRRCPTAGHC